MFLLLSMILLVIKLATAATFSWAWIWGTFIVWIIASIIVATMQDDY